MFLKFYGLREQPFGVTPDPRFLFQSRTHREALASLQYGIQSGRGFIALLAEPGLGKTTLLFELLQRLGNSSRTAFLFQTQSNSRELMGHLLADLELNRTSIPRSWKRFACCRISKLQAPSYCRSSFPASLRSRKN